MNAGFGHCPPPKRLSVSLDSLGVNKCSRFRYSTEIVNGFSNTGNKKKINNKHPKSVNYIVKQDRQREKDRMRSVPGLSEKKIEQNKITLHNMKCAKRVFTTSLLKRLSDVLEADTNFYNYLCWQQ